LGRIGTGRIGRIGTGLDVEATFTAAGTVVRNVLCLAGFGVKTRGDDVRTAGVGSGATGAGADNLACTF
jgi:hypothetical protein